MFLSDNRLLNSVHAADGGAVFIPGGDVPGTYALQKSYFFGFPVVRGANDMALERTGSGKHPLKLNAADHVRETAVTEFVLFVRQKLVRARSGDDRADFYLFIPVFIVKTNGFRFADLFADTASLPVQVEAGVPVNNRNIRQ